MVIVEAGIGAVVALLVGQGLTNIRQSTTKEGDTLLSGTRADGTPVSVQLKNNAIVSPQFDFVRINASQTEASDENNPTFELKKSIKCN